ncbi:TspO and MBR related proteins [Prosthecobacter debontii]|uniref:TspO and MBR related proteins n=1 Tax=Prosthecobacter debontii TaxID=48467 RepID=A0A1T4YH31_9BACT|nr:TspO/MBR family protein [Prosthecobacter debontii]SKB00970.1 TspO and MBR related proteins [Prosthecobacter debontii]
MTPSKRSALALFAFFLVTFSAPILGSLWMPGEWYAALEKPSWNPPSWLFGPVWTVLYIVMAIAAWLVWKKGEFKFQAKPLTWYFIQLGLNAAWTPLFFGAHELLASLVVLAALWVAILMTVLLFRPASSVASNLMIPYLAWVTFASSLNYEIWRLNR